MDCVNIICNKFNINKVDAIRVLMEDGIKLKPTIKHFPWNGIPNKDCCEGLKYCSGLFIQCKNKKIEGSENYCSYCFKQSEQNEHGKPNCGNIQDRMKVSALDYVDPKGRKVLPFSVYLKKKKIDLELGKLEATMNNIMIDEDQYIDVVVKRGRPKKNTDDKPNVTEGKRRGRPKKNKEVEKTNDCENTEDIVNTIVNKDNNENIVQEENEQIDVSKKIICPDDFDKVEDDGNTNDDDDSFEIEVEEINYRGVTYYLSDTDKIYNENSDVIGYWDKELQEINFIKR